MATTFTVMPLATYPANTYPFGPSAVPVGVSQASARIDLTHVTSLTLNMDWDIQISQDNGATWTPLVGGGLSLPRSGFTLAVPGPGLVDSNVRAVPYTEIAAVATNPTNPQRTVKGSVTFSEAVQTDVTVTLT